MRLIAVFGLILATSRAASQHFNVLYLLADDLRPVSKLAAPDLCRFSRNVFGTGIFGRL